MQQLEELEEIKQWLRIDGDEEDISLSSLILSARAKIKFATGLTRTDVLTDIDVLNLYTLLEKLEVSILYDGNLRDMSSKSLNALYMQLEGYYAKVQKTKQTNNIE